MKDGTTVRNVPTEHTRPPIKRPPMLEVASSNIHAIGYDAAARRLVVDFHGGSSYAYENVTVDVYRSFLAAESKGTYFHAAIRTQKEAMPYTRLPSWLDDQEPAAPEYSTTNKPCPRCGLVSHTYGPCLD